jgi:hypothetical protein
MLKNKPLPFFSLIFFKVSLFSASLTLINDSQFPLTAVITNAAGENIASVKLAIGQSYSWNDNQSPFKKQNDNTTTPFTITFLCKDTRPYDYSSPDKKDKNSKKGPSYQMEFGAWTGVPTGATINALGCNNGNKTCVVKKKQTTQKPSITQKNKQKKDAFNDFENNGGETWMNNDGPGWQDSDFSDELE